MVTADETCVQQCEPESKRQKHAVETVEENQTAAAICQENHNEHLLRYEGSSCAFSGTQTISDQGNWNLQFAAKEEECCKNQPILLLCDHACPHAVAATAKALKQLRCESLPHPSTALTWHHGTVTSLVHLKRLDKVTCSPLMRLRTRCRPRFRSS